jgi:hypothetical protein
MWQTLRLYRGAIPWNDIVVLSAKYGAIGSQQFIQPYDQLLNASQADALIGRGIGHQQGPHNFGPCPQDVICAPAHLEARRQRPYELVISAGAGDYARVFHSWIPELRAARIVAPGAEVRQVAGGIGTQRAQLGIWLRDVNGSTIATP